MIQIIYGKKMYDIFFMFFCPLSNAVEVSPLFLAALCQINQKPLSQRSGQGIYNPDLSLRILLHQFLCCDTTAVKGYTESGRKRDMKDILSLLKIWLKECSDPFRIHL